MGRILNTVRPRALFFLPALAAYLGVCVLFFGKVLLPGRYLFGSDFMMFFYPMKTFLRDYVLEHGTLPLWNPYVMCGMPFLADIQVSALYPGGFLFYLLPSETAFGWTIFFHFLLAAMGMFVFASGLGMSRPASWIAGLIYAFNGFVLRHLFAGHLTFFQTMAWAPWMWWAYRRAIIPPLERGGAGGSRGWAAVSIFTSLLLLGGFPQVAFYALLFLLGMAVMPPATGNAAPAGRRIFIFCVTVSIGFVLAAAQLLPTFELASWSTRANGISYDAAMGDSMRLCDLFNIFFPQFFGSPADGTYWGSRSAAFYWETGAYAGLFGVLALFGFRWSVAGRFERFCVVVFGVSIFMAMGANNPLFPVIHALPILKNFRVPAQILYLAVTAVSLLAVALADRIGSFPIRRMPAVAVVLMISVAVFAVFFVVPERFPESYRLYARSEIVSAISGFVVKFSILTVMIGFILSSLAAQKMTASTACVLLAFFTAADLYSGGGDLIQPAKSFQSVREDAQKLRAWPGNTSGGMYRVSASGSYVFGNSTMLTRQYGARGYNPLVLSRTVRFLLTAWRLPIDREDYITSIPPVTRIDHPALRILAVRDVVDADKSETHTLSEALPRAFWIRDAVFLPETQALKEIGDTGFLPTSKIIISGNINTPHPILPPQGGKGFSAEACRFLESEPDDVKIEVDAPDTGGYLFLSDAFYPGWIATVDGAPAGILRANYAFRAVGVPAGRHVVAMTYSPLSLRIGAALSGLGIILCAFLIGRRPA